MPRVYSVLSAFETFNSFVSDTQCCEMVSFRLPNFSGRYILGLALTEVNRRPRLYWLVKESNVHLSLRMIEPVAGEVPYVITGQSLQLCYIQAHAA